MASTLGSKVRERLLHYWHHNPLSDLPGQYPIRLDSVPGNKVIIVATRSPEPNKPFSGGMAPAVYQACKDFSYKLWYGYGERDGKDVQGSFRRALNGAFDGWYNKTVQTIGFSVEGFRIRKVIASKTEWDAQYNEFCNRWVWPISHNLTNFAKNNLEIWDTHGNRHANMTIAKRIAEDLGGDDQTPIWIHDYHHMALADALRKVGVPNPIVYFHHIPLPTPETLETQNGSASVFLNMLQALKACDAVYFQTEETAKRYLRLVGEKVPDNIPAYSGVFIESNNNTRTEKKVMIGHAPISIDTKRLMDVAKTGELGEAAQALDDKLIAENIFINFERCDYSKGILERVLAFEQLLQKNPHLIGKAQLVLGAEPTRTDIEEYKCYANAVREVVERINSIYKIEGGETVIFNNKHIPHNDVMRMLRSNKEGQRRIGLVTPHEDGMNLVAKEHAAAQDIRRASPLIMSDGAGSAAELFRGGKGAIVYQANGFQGTAEEKQAKVVENIARALKQAIDMPQAEANLRAQNMQRHLVEYDIHKWAGFFKGVFTSIQDGRFFPKDKPEVQPVAQVPRMQFGISAA